MAIGYTPWLPPRYYATFKNRLRRLFGSKVPPGMREVILARAGIRLGLIRSRRSSCTMAGVLKELYQEDMRGLVFRKSPLFELIR